MEAARRLAIWHVCVVVAVPVSEEESRGMDVTVGGGGEEEEAGRR